MKKLLAILAALLLAALLAIITLLATLDPNQFKPLISRQVEAKLGRPLVIEGDLGWTLWPRLGLTLEKVALRNPAGFAEPDLLRVGQGTASVALLPLLSRHLEIGEVRLEGAHLLLQTRLDGSSNLDGLTDRPSTAPTDADAPAADSADAAPWRLDIQGIRLTRASARVRNEQTGLDLNITQLDLTLGALAPEAWMPLTIALQGRDRDRHFTLEGSSELRLGRDPHSSQLRRLTLTGSLQTPDLTFERLQLSADALALDTPSPLTLTLKGQQGDLGVDLQLATSARLGRDLASLTLQQLALTGTASGAALPHSPLALALQGELIFDPRNGLRARPLTVQAGDLALSGQLEARFEARPHIRFDLQGKSLDTRHWLIPEKNATPVGNESSAAAGKESGLKEITEAREPDLGGLKKLDLAGTLRLERLHHQGLVFTRPELQLAIKDGIVTVPRLTAGLDEGNLNLSGRLDANPSPAYYQLNGQIARVQILPLLKQFADKDLLAGRASLDLALAGRGLRPAALRRTLAGKVRLKIEDGAIRGVNLAEMVREARATLKGQGAAYVKETRQTDFSALTANFQLGGGKARSSDIQLFSPALRVHGSGETDLVSEGLDFLFNTSVVGSSKGQGGRDVDELKDVTIPVRVTGSWSQPAYALDLKGLLQNNRLLEEKARKEAERGLNKLLGDKAEDQTIKDAADKLLKGLFR